METEDLLDNEFDENSEEEEKGGALMLNYDA